MRRTVAPPEDPPVDDIAELFELERSRLIDLLYRLGDADWARRTRCPEWSVLGLVHHLLGDDLGLLSRRRDGFAGTPPPAGIDEGGFIDWLDQLQAEWVHAARRLSPRLVIELLEWTAPRLVDMLRNESPTSRSANVSWAGPDLVPVWLDQLREVSEYWIHRQQLNEALDESVDLDPTLLRPILHGLRWAYAYRLSQLGRPTSGWVRFTIGSPIDESWSLVDTADGWRFSADGADGSPIATARFTADQAWRHLTKNLDPGTSLDLSGDPGVVGVIERTRAIIGHPD